MLGGVGNEDDLSTESKTAVQGPRFQTKNENRYRQKSIEQPKKKRKKAFIRLRPRSSGLFLNMGERPKSNENSFVQQSKISRSLQQRTIHREPKSGFILYGKRFGAQQAGHYRQQENREQRNAKQSASLDQGSIPVGSTSKGSGIRSDLRCTKGLRNIEFFHHPRIFEASFKESALKKMEANRVKTL